jgi:hypothetical protein
MIFMAAPFFEVSFVMMPEVLHMVIPHLPRFTLDCEIGWGFPRLVTGVSCLTLYFILNNDKEKFFLPIPVISQ